MNTLNLIGQVRTPAPAISTRLDTAAVDFHGGGHILVAISTKLTNFSDKFK